MSEEDVSNGRILAGLAWRIPLYAAVNVATIWAMSELGCRVGRPVLLRTLGFVWIAFFSSWATAFTSAGEMLFAAARGQLTMPAMAPNADWYMRLRMPAWTPPGWLFPIMWLIVSKPTQVAACMRVAAALAAGGAAGPKVCSLTAPPWLLPVAAWALHLSLGDAWNEVFFSRMRIGLGAAVIGVFYAALLGTALLFAGIDRRAGLLMLPTCLWVTVAASLSFSIYRLNS